MSRRAEQVIRSLANWIEDDNQKPWLLMCLALDLGLAHWTDAEIEDLQAEEEAEAMADEIAEALRALAGEVTS